MPSPGFIILAMRVQEISATAVSKECQGSFARESTGSDFLVSRFGPCHVQSRFQKVNLKYLLGQGPREQNLQVRALASAFSPVGSLGLGARVPRGFREMRSFSGVGPLKILSQGSGWKCAAMP